jgi:hypothetical protein
MRADGVVPSTIAKTLKIGRATIYRALRSEPLLIAAREELPAPEGGGKNPRQSMLLLGPLHVRGFCCG